MAELLLRGGHEDWAASLGSLAAQIEVDPVRTCATIVGMFGGMGSLNDLVLYTGCTPLIRENQELDALRSKLFSLTRS